MRERHDALWPGQEYSGPGPFNEIAALFLLTAYNLISMIDEKTSSVFKDIRFWLVLASFLLLVWIMVRSYPV
ncbi:MAG: hypothetical protein J5I94_03985 [Phaeodactylibacter sp.]|nr:hypothetical protein [Phaeodactylibacter sp.]